MMNRLWPCKQMVEKVLSKHVLISITGHGSSPAAGLSREPGVYSHLCRTSASLQWALNAAQLTEQGDAVSQHFLKYTTSYKPYIYIQTQIQKSCSVLKCLWNTIVWSYQSIWIKWLCEGSLFVHLNYSKWSINIHIEVSTLWMNEFILCSLYHCFVLFLPLNDNFLSS